MSQLLGAGPERVRSDPAQPRRASGTSELTSPQSNSPDQFGSSPQRRGPRRPRSLAGPRAALGAIVGVVALGLVGLGVRAVPTVLTAPGAGPLIAAPAPATPTTSVPAETSPSPAPAESAVPRKQITPKPSSSPKIKVKAKPVSVPATGPGRYSYASQDVAPASSGGTLIRYDVRVEDNLDIDPDQAATFIAGVLNDKRSWRGSGRWRFQLVSSADQATLHAYIVTPGTTDQLCAPLLTQGEVSCENGNRVVLNAKRWLLGADAYGDDVTNYRRYLVNHEFGHYLGHGHVGCPGKGRQDPVMMQQTKGLGGCKPNPWPVGTDY